MKEFDLRYKDICLHIICEDYHEKIIKSFVKNHYEIGDFGNNPTYTLNTLEKSMKRSGNFAHMVDKWFNNASLDCYIDNVGKVCYFTNFDGNLMDKINLLQYFTVNLFNRLLQIKGYIALHSSAVEKNGQGVSFIAGRNSGKTVSLLNMMSAGYNSVANDKLAVIADGENVDGYGVAQSTSVRMSPEFLKDKRNFKYIQWAKLHNIEIKDKNMVDGNNIVLLDNELAELNGVKQVPSASIRALFVPQYNPELKSLKLTRLSQDEISGVVQSQTIELVHATNEFFKNIDLGIRGVEPEKTYERLKRLPSFRMEQNENTTDQAITMVGDMIK